MTTAVNPYGMEPSRWPFVRRSRERELIGLLQTTQAELEFIAEQRDALERRYICNDFHIYATGGHEPGPWTPCSRCGVAKYANEAVASRTEEGP